LIIVYLAQTSAYGDVVGGIHGENGVLENTQVALLLISAWLFAVRSLSMPRVSVFLWIGAWFCLSCILRELDIEDMNVSQWVIAVGSGPGRNAIMGVGWMLLGVFALKHALLLKENYYRILRSRTMRLVYASGVLLLLGSLFDRDWVLHENGKLLEEAFETAGYFLILCAAITFRSFEHACFLDKS
jgi:hypothetical protein